MITRSNLPLAESPEVLKLAHGTVDTEVVRRVVTLLKSGGLVAVRTDTVYGILASVNRLDALQRLTSEKNRPAAKSFALLAADWLGVRQVTSHLPPAARYLGARYWPGPITLILPATTDLPEEVVGPGRSVAVRIPNDAFLLAVLRELRCAVAAPSANRSGETPAASAAEAARIFGNALALVVDSGTPAGTRPSTLIRCTGTPPEILREGPIAISADELSFGREE